MKTNNASLGGALRLLLIVLLPVLLGACTSAQLAANATVVAGSDFAYNQLSKNPAAVKGLTDLADALPLFPLGKVTPYQAGVISGELAPLVAAENALPQDKDQIARVGNILSTIANANANGGNPTILDAANIAFLTDFANGIKGGIQYWQGRQSTVNPPAP